MSALLLPLLALCSSIFVAAGTTTANITLAWNTSIGNVGQNPVVQVAKPGGEVVVPCVSQGDLNLSRIDGRTGVPQPVLPVSLPNYSVTLTPSVTVGELAIISLFTISASGNETVGLQATSISTGALVWTQWIGEGAFITNPAANHAMDLVYVCVPLQTGGFYAVALQTATGHVVYNGTLVAGNCQIIAPLRQADGTETVLVLGSTYDQPQLWTANLSHRLWMGTSFIPSNQSSMISQSLYRGALFDENKKHPHHPVVLSPAVIVISYTEDNFNQVTVSIDPMTGATKWVQNNTANTICSLTMGITTMVTVNTTTLVGYSLHDGSIEFGTPNLDCWDVGQVMFVPGSGYVVAKWRELMSFDEASGAPGWRFEFPMTAAGMSWSSMAQEYGGRALFAVGQTTTGFTESVVMRFDINL